MVFSVVDHSIITLKIYNFIKTTTNNLKLFTKRSCFREIIIIKTMSKPKKRVLLDSSSDSDSNDDTNVSFFCKKK